jgi:polysaccharide deacetylase family sporulation protein PdaB
MGKSNVFILPVSKKACVAVSLSIMMAAALWAFLPNGSNDSVPIRASKDNIPIYSVKTGGSQIALTFDIAWGTGFTDKLLDILDEYGAKATFYVTGKWAEANSAELQRIAGRGHEIGSHGYSHRDFTKLGGEDIARDLALASDAIHRVAGMRPATFRAPYGAWDARVVDAVCGQQYDFIQWDVDSLDWKGLTPEAMEARVLPNVQSGSILLFHNDGKHTAEALPAMLDKLREKGFKFVTVTELIGEGLEG